MNFALQLACSFVRKTHFKENEDMMALKLFGFPPDALSVFQEKLRLDNCGLGRDEELEASFDAEAIWLVAIDAHERYRRVLTARITAGNSPPPAVLWVPEGSDPLSFDDWWEDFHAQLRAWVPEDIAFLQRIGRCRRVLEWREQLEVILPEYLEHNNSIPRSFAFEDLPVSDVERIHLQQCVECQHEVYAWLRTHGQLRRAILCPSPEEVAIWLEGSADSVLEEHIRTCVSCHSDVQRQASLWAGGHFISRSKAEEKLIAVGILPAPVSDWLKATLHWQRVASAAVILLALSHMASQVSRRSEDTSVQVSKASLEDALLERLDAGSPITLTDEGKWLAIKREGEDLLIRAGRSPADRFQAFRIEFRHLGGSVLTVKAQNGMARLTPHHLQGAHVENADEIAVVVDDAIGGA